jgi:hypothetical protein
VVGHVSGEGLASAGHTDALARELDEMLARPLSSPVTGHVSPSVKSLGHIPTRLTSQTEKTRGEKIHGNRRAHKSKRVQQKPNRRDQTRKRHQDAHNLATIQRTQI